MSEQLDMNFDQARTLEKKLQAQWTEQRQHAHQWTPEAMCAVWVNNSFADREAFQTMPKYDQERWLREYQHEQGLKDRNPKYRMRSPREIAGNAQERYAHKNKIAQKMADKLAADWALGRPASIVTYDIGVASIVTCILGRTVEAAMPPDESNAVFHRDGDFTMKGPLKRHWLYDLIEPASDE